MFRKIICLVSVLVLCLSYTSYADVVIGDFEGNMDNWVPGWDDNPVLTLSDIGVTSGTSSLALSVSPGWAWALQWNAPEGIDLSEYDAVSADVTWVASEWIPNEGSTGWVQFQLMAINSGGPSGWKQANCIDPVNPDYPGSWDPVNWGDQTRTLTWDLNTFADGARYDSTGTDWLQIIFSVNNGDLTTVGNYYIDNVKLIGGEPTVPFSIAPVEDIELGNDSALGPDSSSNGSGLGARDTDDPRRRVSLISYDISSLKGRGPVSNVSLSLYSHDQHAAANVYGIVEEQDLLEVESLTWNTAPGVKNDPAPALDSPVALDMNDLTDVLLTIEGPGEKGVRFSTDTSDALADFINADTDGVITLLLAAAEEGTSLIIRARQIEGGELLQGEAAPIANIIWVSDNAKIEVDPNQPSDIGFVELLRDAGYSVDYKGEEIIQDPCDPENNLNPDWHYWWELDDDKMAELNAADLVIISRVANSGQYDDKDEATGYDERILWNSVTTPMISMSAHLARSGYNKWGWRETSGTPDSNVNATEILVPDHPIFAGATIVDGVAQLLTDDMNVNGGGDEDPNTNGTVLATRIVDGAVMIAEWPAGVEYFEGMDPVYVAGGPRMFFAAGCGRYCDQDGLYNLTADGETVFLNAVDYMLTPRLEVAEELLVDVSAADPSAGTETWVNYGTLGDFNYVSDPNDLPVGSKPMTPDPNGPAVEEFEGVPVVHIMSDKTHLQGYMGPDAPATIIGSDDRSIEMWIADLNSELQKDKCMIAWGVRGTDGQNMSANFGYKSFGALGLYGDDYDTGFDPDALPTVGTLHHLVYVISNNTATIYVDGVLNNVHAFAGVLATPEAPINLFMQNQLDDTKTNVVLSDNGLANNHVINSIRVHDGVLTEAQVLNNYEVGPDM